MTIAELLAQPFGRYDELIAAHARARPQATALIEGERSVSFATLDAMVERVAASLQRDGLRPHQAVAICTATSLEYAALFIGILRAGGAVAPLPPSATPQNIADMVTNAGADLLFLDTTAAEHLGPVAGRIAARRIALDGSDAGERFSRWLAPEGSRPRPVAVGPDDPCNLIYSSGPTGTPKGIVQPQRMRWFHVQRARDHGYTPEATTLISTPLYSNTTLVSFLPALGIGGCVVLMPKFDALEYLRLAEKHRVSHTMLVPVQYRRIMAHARFGEFDLSAFRMKFCTSAPFAAELRPTSCAAGRAG
jgi:acyl-CoA synthetase (AMP-forming)/AMP-acid ligase II